MRWYLNKAVKVEIKISKDSRNMVNSQVRAAVAVSVT